MRLTFILTAEADTSAELQSVFLGALEMTRWQYGNYGSPHEIERTCAKRKGAFSVEGLDSGNGWLGTMKIVSDESEVR